MAAGPGLHVSGWTFFHDQRGPVDVDVWLDGRWVGRCTTGDARPDVGAAFRSRHAEQSGFCLDLPSASLECGRHALWVTTSDQPLPLAATFFRTA